MDGRLLTALGLTALTAAAAVRGSRGVVRRGRGARPKVPGKVHGEIHLDGTELDAGFDAVPWLQQASESDLKALRDAGWGGDYAADDVAWWMADPEHGNNTDVAHLLHRVLKDELGFEVHLDDEQAIPWLNANRPGWDA